MEEDIEIVRPMTKRSHKPTPIIQIAWQWLRRAVENNKGYAILACVLCIFSVIAWSYFWAAVPYNLRQFVFYYSFTLIGFLVLGGFFFYEYLTTYGLVSLLPPPVKESIKTYLFDKSLVDIITHDSWIKGFLSDVFAALFVELDEDEVQRILQRMPSPLQTAVTQRGVLHLTPAMLRSFILPREEWPDHKGNLPILRKASEQHLDELYDEYARAQSSPQLGGSLTLRQRCASCGSIHQLDEEESKASAPFALSSPSSFEQTFPSASSTRSFASPRSPHRRDSHTKRPRSAPKNATPRQRRRSSVTSASRHSNNIRSLSPLRRDRKRVRVVTSSSGGSKSESSSPRSASSARSFVPRDGGVFSMLDARVKQSFETAVASYVTEPLDRVPDNTLRLMLLSTGAAAMLMIKRSRTVRQAATRGGLVGVYVLMVSLFAFSFGVLHFGRNSSERRRIIKYSRFAAYRYAQLYNAYVRAKNSRAASALSAIGKSKVTHGLLVLLPVAYGVYRASKNDDVRRLIGLG